MRSSSSGWPGMTPMTLEAPDKAAGSDAADILIIRMAKLLCRIGWWGCRDDTAGSRAWSRDPTPSLLPAPRRARTRRPSAAPGDRPPGSVVSPHVHSPGSGRLHGLAVPNALPVPVIRREASAQSLGEGLPRACVSSDISFGRRCQADALAHSPHGWAKIDQPVCDSRPSAHLAPARVAAQYGNAPSPTPLVLPR